MPILAYAENADTRSDQGNLLRLEHLLSSSENMCTFQSDPLIYRPEFKSDVCSLGERQAQEAEEPLIFKDDERSEDGGNHE
jgi:hypothetical protein